MTDSNLKMHPCLIHAYFWLDVHTPSLGLPFQGDYATIVRRKVSFSMSVKASWSQQKKPRPMVWQLPPPSRGGHQPCIHKVYEAWHHSLRICQWEYNMFTVYRAITTSTCTYQMLRWNWNHFSTWKWTPCLLCPDKWNHLYRGMASWTPTHVRKVRGQLVRTYPGEELKLVGKATSSTASNKVHTKWLFIVL